MFLAAPLRPAHAERERAVLNVSCDEVAGQAALPELPRASEDAPALTVHMRVSRAGTALRIPIGEILLIRPGARTANRSNSRCLIAEAQLVVLSKGRRGDAHVFLNQSHHF